MTASLSPGKRRRSPQSLPAVPGPGPPGRPTPGPAPHRSPPSGRRCPTGTNLPLPPPGGLALYRPLPLLALDLQPAPPVSAPSPPDWSDLGTPAIQLVLVNGHFCPALSRLEGLPPEQSPVACATCSTSPIWPPTFCPAWPRPPVSRRSLPPSIAWALPMGWGCGFPP
ncbi:MAG: hypothetical protein LVS60_14850 [Nodosilinea sp. LVE1205-7]|jgi:hypothetical protein